MKEEMTGVKENLFNGKIAKVYRRGLNKEGLFHEYLDY